MADTATLLAQLDRRFEQAVAEGAALDTLPISDWAAFAAGYAARNATRADARRTRGLVAEKIACRCWDLDWVLPRLIEYGYTIFPYEQTQSHLSFLSSLKRLEADSLIYLAAQAQAQQAQTEANRSAESAPLKAPAPRYYDDWGNWIDCYTRHPSEWDIERVNGINQALTELITYLTLFEAEVETGADPHGYAAVVAAALPVIQSFQAGFPAFCAVLNEANVLDLTEKVIVREPVQLQIALPEITGSERSLQPRAIAAQADKTAADFQGYMVAIVLEPRSAEEIAADARDLHGNFISKEEIRKAALHWSIHGRKVRIEHDASTEALNGEHPDWLNVFNWIQEGDTVIGGYLVKDGTWLQSWQAMSPAAVEALKNYEINGLSPGGYATFWRDPKPESEA